MPTVVLYCPNCGVQETFFASKITLDSVPPNCARCNRTMQPIAQAASDPNVNVAYTSN